MSAVALTVGTFDGVHLGHRRLLSQAARLAGDEGLELVVLTLDRHPLSLLRPEHAPGLLTGLGHKLELLGRAEGVARTEVLVFDRERAEQAPESFVADTLAGELGARLLVVGSNFRFGRDGAGDLALAEQVGRRVGLSVAAMDLVEAAPGLPVSSSEIRRFVAAGRLERAAELLGRPHELRGLLGPPAAPGDGHPGGTGPSARAPGASPPRAREVAVDRDLLAPPPGPYEVVVGPVGGQGEPLVPALAEILPESAAGTTVLRLGALSGTQTDLPSWWLAGGPARVVFPAPEAGPVGRDQVLEQACNATVDR